MPPPHWDPLTAPALKWYVTSNTHNPSARKFATSHDFSPISHNFFQLLLQNLTFFLPFGGWQVCADQWLTQRRRAGGPPRLISRSKWGPKSRKNSFWDRAPFMSGSGWPRPTLIWRSGSTTADRWLTIGLRFLATFCPFYLIKALSTRTQTDLKTDFYFPFRFSFLLSRKRRFRAPKTQVFHNSPQGGNF